MPFSRPSGIRPFRSLAAAAGSMRTDKCALRFSSSYRVKHNR